MKMNELPETIEIKLHARRVMHQEGEGLAMVAYQVEFLHAPGEGHFADLILPAEEFAVMDQTDFARAMEAQLLRALHGDDRDDTERPPPSSQPSQEPVVTSRGDGLVELNGETEKPPRVVRIPVEARLLEYTEQPETYPDGTPAGNVHRLVYEVCCSEAGTFTDGREVTKPRGEIMLDAKVWDGLSGAEVGQYVRESVSRDIEDDLAEAADARAVASAKRTDTALTAGQLDAMTKDGRVVLAKGDEATGDWTQAAEPIPEGSNPRPEGGTDASK